MALSSGQKSALTRRINELRETLSSLRADRGLWENLSDEDLARNKKFVANIEGDLNRLEDERRRG